MSLPRHARVSEQPPTGGRPSGGSSRVGKKTLPLLGAALAMTGVQAIGSPANAATTATGATTRPETTAGSAAVGTASYPVPAGAGFVSPTGADTATGAAGTPVRTIARALAITPAGGTIVLRGGVYHESLTVTKTVTIQNYPGETVWLDGAEKVTGWQPAGSVWRKSGWNHVFDHSPTTTFGAPDGTTANWTFLNPSYPMAAHPDQLWLNGVEMTQVDTLAGVTAGKFFYDEADQSLYVGTDPTTKTAEASTLQKVFSVRAPNTVITGIGIRRYAPSVPHQGALTLEKPGIVLENDTILDTATAGIALTSSDITVANTTIDGSGLMGLRGRLADRAKLLSVRVTNNNDQHFNYSPPPAASRSPGQWGSPSATACSRPTGARACGWTSRSPTATSSATTSWPTSRTASPWSCPRPPPSRTTGSWTTPATRSRSTTPKTSTSGITPSAATPGRTGSSRTPGTRPTRRTPSTSTPVVRFRTRG